MLASIIDEKVLSKTTKHAKDAKDAKDDGTKDAKDDGNEEKEGILVLPLTRSNSVRDPSAPPFHLEI